MWALASRSCWGVPRTEFLGRRPEGETPSRQPAGRRRYKDAGATNALREVIGFHGSAVGNGDGIEFQM